MGPATNSIKSLSSPGDIRVRNPHRVSNVERLNISGAPALIDRPPAPPKDRDRDGDLPASTTVRQLWRDIRALNLTDARVGLEAAEQTLICGDLGGTRTGYGDLFAIHAMTLVLEDDTLSAAAAAEQALRWGASEPFARLSDLVLRFCAWKAGAAPASSADTTLCALQATGAPKSRTPNEVLTDVLDLSLAAAIEFSQLQVAAAERLARCALRRADQAPLAWVSPAGVLGRILYARGLVREAEQLLRPRTALFRSMGSLDCVGNAYGVLAAAAAHVGDHATALATLDEASDLAEARNWPRLLAAMLAERVRLCEADDERHAALWLAQLRNLAERHRPQTRCARSEIVCHLFRAQVHAFLKFRTGAPPQAALAHLRYDAWLGQDLQASIWVKLAEAQCLWAVEEEDEALRHLADVLRSAAATGLRQHLIDAGPFLAPMIERLLQDDGVDQGLLAFTLCLMDDLGRSSGDAQPRRRAPHGSDRLTLRERDVLKLIGEGRTNKVIAQIQGVAPETIKTHVKNIFIKLGVERRAQAVAKAERLGML